MFSQFKLLNLLLFFSLGLCLAACGSSGSGGSGSASDASKEASPASASVSQFWNGEASLVHTASGIGESFNFHFLSAVEGSGEKMVYYVLSPSFYEQFAGASVGLATSNDGVNFRDQGEVLSVGGDRLFLLSALSDFEHPDGREDSRCQGWSAGVEHAGGYLAASRDALKLESGAYSARFTLTIYDAPHDSSTVALVEILSKNNSERIAMRELQASEFPDVGIESSFNLDFSLLEQSDLEIRVFSFGAATVCLRSASIHLGSNRTRDNRIASFPSVYREGNEWIMLYEGASDASQGIHGEIRMATSSDGYSWRREASPILQSTAPWQLVNIGTPSLLRHEGRWFLLYHGFDGARLNLGVASGDSLHNLEPLNANLPVLSTGEGWDSGTIGKRSIVYEEPYFYMAYEGSTLHRDFGKAQWGTGLARSQDLVNWEKYPQNPILGPTPGGFGFDGPEFIKTPDGVLHIYYRNMLGSTDRASILLNEALE